MKAAEVFGLDASLIERVKSETFRQSAPRPMITGFITLKAQSELDFHPMTSTEGLETLKRELLHLTLN
jgi:dTDP-4-dehydrorhamnose reductase